LDGQQLLGLCKIKTCENTTLRDTDNTGNRIVNGSKPNFTSENQVESTPGALAKIIAVWPELPIKIVMDANRNGEDSTR